MSSRDYIRHLVSANTAPNGARVGDEYFDPTTNKLFKVLAVNGNAVTSVEVLTSPTGGIPTFAVILAQRALFGTILNIPSPGVYTLGSNDGRQNLEVFVDGYKFVRGIEYAETTNNSITTLVAIPAGSTIEYRILR
jgi:hypothetical protein